MKTKVKRCPLCRGQIECYNLGAFSFSVADLKMQKILKLCINRDLSFIELTAIPKEDDFVFSDRESRLSNHSDYIIANYEKLKCLYGVLKDRQLLK